MVDTQANGGAIVAVGEAKASLPAPDLASLTIDTQTKAVGIIMPPPDIRAIVDKTANWVARNGTGFEQRILNNEATNTKFNFLKPGDPYNAYYQYKVKAIQEGDKPAQPGAPIAAPGPAAAMAPAPAAAPLVVQATPAAPPKVLEKPEEAHYTVRVPEGLSSLDLDIIKLTAQFVARNGKSFLTGLAQREHANPQFNFLKPTGSMFGFFTALCDAYSRVLMPPKGLTDKLRKDVGDRAGILERCLRRLEWERAAEAEAKAQADEQERERQQMQSIDWHDFVIVETIEFFDDEDEELPPPLSVRDVVQLNRQAGGAGPGPAAEAAAAADAEMEVEMDESERAMVAEAATAGGLPPADGGTAAAEVAAAAAAAEEEEEEGPIRIVKNYQRPVAPKRPTGFDPTKLAVSPITGELVPLEEMAEHMRVSLIDPKWKEQRDAMLAKIRGTTRAGDDEIGRNLMKLANTRPDIFGSTQEELDTLLQASIKDAQISGNDRPVAWDGVTRKGDELNAQLRAIQQQKTMMGADQAMPVPQRPMVGPGAPPPTLRPPGAPGSMPPPGPPASMPPPPPRPNVAAPPGPPAGEGEPEAKRLRVAAALVPEADWLSSNLGPSKVLVLCPLPNGSSQVVEVGMASLAATVDELKAALASTIGLPVERQVLSRPGVGVLTGSMTLASYNVGPEVQLALTPQ